ncbi:MAG: TonB-dependent receptor [Mangrovibacterium sp.]
MKVLFILLTVTFVSFASGSYSQTKNFTFQLKNVNLLEVFEQIEAQSDIQVAYDVSAIDLTRKINIDVSKESVEKVLQKALENTGLSFRVMDRYVIITKDHEVSTPVSLQQKGVSGKVTDSSGGPLPGVSVVIKGTANGTITSEDGTFSLANILSNTTLVFSFVGMKTQEIPVSGKTVINVTMVEEAIGLEEVVAIGYGSLSNRRVSSSISIVKADQIKDAPNPTVDQAIIGKVPGMQIKQVSGQPGSSSVIRIRGDASISTNNMPLYVIDGFPVNFGYDETRSPLQLLNPSDIESISILKDAASTSIYGSRASNGVVIIKTKSGQTGKTNITVNYSSMLQTYHPHSKIKVLNGEQFAQYAIDHIEDPMRANGIPIPSDKSHIPEDYRNPAAIGKGTDWFEEIMQVAPAQNYDISITSGNDKAKSFISAGYYNQDGVIKETKFERIAARANMMLQLNKVISAGMNIAPTYSWGRRAPTGGPTWFSQSVLSSVYQASPVVSPYNEDGTLRPYIESSGTFGYPNPLHLLKNIDDLYKNFTSLTNAYFQVDLQNGLVLKTSGNLFYDDLSGDYFRSSEVRNFAGGDHPNDAVSRLSTQKTINWVWENTLNYTKTLAENHHFDVLAGYTAEKNAITSYYAEGVKFPNDVIRTVQSGEIDNVSSGKYEQTLISYLGRLNYSYKDKYLASVTMRRDGSSRFGTNNKWGNFPSVSLGWRISSESFMENVKLISDMKLRASYGLTGNKEIGDYLYISSLTRKDYVLNDQVQAGQVVSSFENLDLGWETTKQLDLGLEVSFLNNRYNLTVEYYNKMTRDMLLSVPVAAASGYGSAWMNIGKMRNRGMEFALNARNKIGKLSIETDLNVYFNRNTVLATNKFNDPILGYGNWTITTVGFPISSFYGSVSDGIFMNQQEFDKGPHFSNAAEEGVGGPRYLDIDGSGIHQHVNDYSIIGTPEPICSYGLSSRLEYKDFDLSFVFNGQLGGQISNGSLQWLFLMEGPLTNNSIEVLDRWRSPENPGKGIIPVASTASVRVRMTNDFWIQDNTYLWLRNVTFGYNLPKTLLSKQDIVKSARIYFTAMNTFLLTRNKWGMPEASTGGDTAGNTAINSGIDQHSYPIPMSFTLGANITF